MLGSELGARELSRKVLSYVLFLLVLLSLIPLLADKGARKQASSPAVNLESPVDTSPFSAEESSALGGVELDKPSLVVDSDDYLDPQAGQIFLVSAKFRLIELPAVGVREKIVVKYDGNNKPYPGWAIALHRFSSSARPSVYWKNIKGEGGWYTFNAVSLNPGKWYVITLLARGGDFLSVYLEKLPAKTGGIEGESVSVANSVADSSRSISFCGGFDVSDAGLAKTASPLIVSGLIVNGKGGGVEVESLLIASPPLGRPTVEEVKRIIAGGPAAAIHQGIDPADLLLWITPNGKDLSRFSRSVTRVEKRR